MERYTLFLGETPPYLPPPQKNAFFSRKSVACGWSVTSFLGAKCTLPPPKNKPASAAKPISTCLYKTLTLMLYNLINHPNLMGARCSCGQCNCLKNLSFPSLALVGVLAPRKDDGADFGCIWIQSNGNAVAWDMWIHAVPCLFWGVGKGFLINLCYFPKIAK